MPADGVWWHNSKDGGAGVGVCVCFGLLRLNSRGIDVLDKQMLYLHFAASLTVATVVLDASEMRYIYKLYM